VFVASKRSLMWVGCNVILSAGYGQFVTAAERIESEISPFLALLSTARSCSVNFTSPLAVYRFKSCTKHMFPVYNSAASQESGKSARQDTNSILRKRTRKTASLTSECTVRQMLSGSSIQLALTQAKSIRTLTALEYVILFVSA
jgi:hypothetical protein